LGLDLYSCSLNQRDRCFREKTYFWMGTSYAAGLTPISFWRFAIATVLGLIPASFLLAHFGGEMIQVNFQAMMLFVLIVGLVTILPMLFSRIRNKFLTSVDK